MKRKTSNKKIQWLLSELPFLEEEQILMPEQTESLKTYYTSRLKSFDISRFILLLIGITAGLSILSGLVLVIVNFNWHMIPLRVKAFLALLFTLIPLGTAWYFHVSSSFSTRALEIFGILYSICFGVSLFYLGQIYHLPPNSEMYFLVWSISTLIILYLFKSISVFPFYLLLVILFCASAENSSFMVHITYVLSAGAIPFYIINRRKRSKPAQLTLDYFFILFVLFFTGFLPAQVFEWSWLLLYSLFFSICYMVSLFLYDDTEDSLLVRPYLFTGITGTGILLYTASFQFMWERTALEIELTPHNTIHLLFLAAAVAGAVLLLYRCIIQNKTISNLTAAVPLFFVLCLSVSGFLNTNGHGWIILLAVNLYIVLLSLHAFYTGYNNRSLVIINAGAVLLIGTGLTRFLDVDFDILTRGFVFIAVGIFFFLLNMFLKKQFENGGGK